MRPTADAAYFGHQAEVAAGTTRKHNIMPIVRLSTAARAQLDALVRVNLLPAQAKRFAFGDRVWLRSSCLHWVIEAASTEVQQINDEVRLLNRDLHRTASRSAGLSALDSEGVELGDEDGRWFQTASERMEEMRVRRSLAGLRVRDLEELRDAVVGVVIRAVVRIDRDLARDFVGAADAK